MGKFDSDLVDVSVIVKAETDKAYKVWAGTDKDEDVWLPKSQIEIEYGPRRNGSRVATVTMPQWLAHEKKLI